MADTFVLCLDAPKPKKFGCMVEKWECKVPRHSIFIFEMVNVGLHSKFAKSQRTKRTNNKPKKNPKKIVLLFISCVWTTGTRVCVCSGCIRSSFIIVHPCFWTRKIQIVLIAIFYVRFVSLIFIDMVRTKGETKGKAKARKTKYANSMERTCRIVLLVYMLYSNKF